MREPPTYRVESSEDVIAHFQTRLDRFPAGVFAEFGAILVGDAERVDRLIFPESMMVIPDADDTLRDYQPTAFPEVRLVAGADTDDLYVKMTCQVLNDDDLLAYESLIVDIGRAFFVSDIWDAVSVEDRPRLAKANFGPDMTAQQWASRINQFLSDVSPSPALAQDEETLLMLRELPFSILQDGCVGSNGSYRFQPEFIRHALAKNRFVFATNRDKENPVLNLGNVHIHSLVNNMGALERAVADIVGADVVRRNPSVPDILHHRTSNDIFGTVSRRYGSREHIHAMYTFGGIISVDGQGKATGIRWWDFFQDGLDLQRLVDLTNAVEESFMSERPDVRLIAEYYQFVDSITTVQMPSYVG